jgi:hypothetical protein
MIFGTTVKNPVHRAGRDRYSKCTYCAKYYTQLGISRHWSRCPKNPKNQPKE